MGTWGEGVRLVILDSPYRCWLEPLLQYIEDIAAQRQPKRVNHDRGAPLCAEALVEQCLAHPGRCMAPFRASV